MRRAQGSFLLSSLDVFCCGFGGAIFLFLILSSVKSEEPVPSPLHYLVGQWDVSSSDTRETALRVQIRLRDGTVVSVCDALQVHPCTHRVAPGKEVLIDRLEVRALFSAGSVLLMVGAPEDEAIDAYEIQLRCDSCQADSEISGWYEYKSDTPSRVECPLSIGQSVSVFPAGENSTPQSCPVI